MIKTGNPVISIYTEMTPNPETMKFVANKLLYPGKSIDFPDPESAKPSPLAAELFGFPFYKKCFYRQQFCDPHKNSRNRMGRCYTFHSPIFERLPRRRKSSDQ